LVIGWIINNQKKLAQKILDIKVLFENSNYFSNVDNIPRLNQFGRKDTTEDSLPHLISRAEITNQKPWLIPEIYNTPHKDTAPVLHWIENAEQFIRNYELDLLDSNIHPWAWNDNNSKPKAIDYESGNRLAVDLSQSEERDQYFNDYLEDITFLVKNSLFEKQKGNEDHQVLNNIKVSFLKKDTEKWVFDNEQIKIETNSYNGNLKDYKGSKNVLYWLKAFDLREIYLNAENSDMGLCILLRSLYLYGNLPQSFGEEKDLKWRIYTSGNKEKFEEFFAIKVEGLADDDPLKQQIISIKFKLEAILTLNACYPRSARPQFSLIFQEIVKQAILGYKFWIDEPYHAYEYHGEEHDEDKAAGINKARNDIGKGTLFAEMEYWSENHYIMFASSEYLAGQLWENEIFQPAKDFLKPGDDIGKMTGSQRIERGKARVLKYLNNRLLFGWSEFNSSGYYREHMWALLNLVDFALDEEVKMKATMVMDLLVFDIVRFQHKGAMGAAGGRSQHKSKCNGWDNGLGDVLEIMLGNRGIFVDEKGEIGCSFATTTYKVPDVLMEIGVNPFGFDKGIPSFFTDRSRVSITFEEAPKYGILYSKKSDQKESFEWAYQSRRNIHFKELKEINEAIQKSHYEYGQKEDDTVFWWSLSAYFNKEVVINTINCIDKFKLNKTGVFNDKLGGILSLVNFVIPLISNIGNGILVSHLGLPVLEVTLWKTIFEESDAEGAAEDLSIFVEGSSRTRANILTFRNEDVMLSSIQNFRPGQLNFQSNVQQATISGEINVFVTSSFPGLVLSNLPFITGGASVGSLLFGTAGAVLGAYFAIDKNESDIKYTNPLGRGAEADGPSWWTGYWALPMVVQHENAAIIAFDYHWTQRRLTDVGSHAWFPKNAFDAVEKKRTSAYQDENFFLWDITDIGPKGFWIFGKKTHHENLENHDENVEAYIGVFSNQRPKFLDKEHDFFKHKMEEKQLQDIYEDYFANHDYYADGKNIWIMQVGNKKEYGSFENFKNRVSQAKIEMDDAGTIECAYHIPKPDGRSEKLFLKYGEKCKINDKPFDVDFYPRFENPYIRGGRVEWGQRDYVIEHRGKCLYHQFNDLKTVFRSVIFEDIPTEPDKILAFVIYIHTEDEDMDLFSVCKATLKSGDVVLALDEVVAAGHVDEHTQHDSEIIFLSDTGTLSPDLTIELKHPAIEGGDDKPAWKMSFQLKALMGDHRLYNCTLNVSTSQFNGKQRNNILPFVVDVSRWRTWQSTIGNFDFKFWQSAAQPGFGRYYFNYVDIISINKDNNLLQHSRLATSPAIASPWKIIGSTGQTPNFNQFYSIYSISTQPGNLIVFAINNGQLFYCHYQQGGDISESRWMPLKPTTIPTIFGIPIPNAEPIAVPLTNRSQVFAVNGANFQSAINLYSSAIDGNFYCLENWKPGNEFYPSITSYWNKIKTEGFFSPNFTTMPSGKKKFRTMCGTPFLQ
jgi:hypothetical protein